MNRREDAVAVVAQTYANGDTQNPIVLVTFKESIDTIEYEKNVGESLSLVQMVKTPVARKRVALAVSAAVFSTITGEISCHSRQFSLEAKEEIGDAIASYYLRTMLNNAGVTNTTTQL